MLEVLKMIRCMLLCKLKGYEAWEIFAERVGVVRGAEGAGNGRGDGLCAILYTRSCGEWALYAGGVSCARSARGAEWTRLFHRRRETLVASSSRVAVRYTMLLTPITHSERGGQTSCKGHSITS